MTELLNFAGDHPWLTFFLALITAELVLYPLKLINRWIRHRNIVARGWPPAHLDGDGDVIKKDEA